MAVTLMLVSILLTLGMVWLPSLSGSGTENIFTRAWLFFGLTVFFAHYVHYLEQGTGSKKRHQETTVHLRKVRSAVRNARHM